MDEIDDDRTPERKRLDAWSAENPRDQLGMVALAAWLNTTPDKLPKEMRLHTCQATKDAWARVEAAVRADLAQAPAPVRVKPLVWLDFFDRGAKAQAWNQANYMIQKWSDSRWEISASYPGYSTFIEGTDRFYPTLETAKAAAQADYEARIIAALEAPSDALAAIARHLAPGDDLVERLLRVQWSVTGEPCADGNVDETCAHEAAARLSALTATVEELRYADRVHASANAGMKQRLEAEAATLRDHLARMEGLTAQAIKTALTKRDRNMTFPAAWALAHEVVAELSADAPTDGGSNG